MEGPYLSWLTRSRYPKGKLVFLMPTKPLVTQQHEACQTTCGIPGDDAATITGDDPIAWRERTVREQDTQITSRTLTAVLKWKEKRVIYATPQTFLIDMFRKRVDPLDIVCLIIGKHLLDDS